MLDARNEVEKRLKPIVGSSQSNVLKSAPKVPLTQIHVSRLHPDTDASDVRSFLSQITSDMECDKLSSRRADVYSPFKITLPKEFYDEVMDSAFWPGGITVNKFFMKRASLIKEK
ncbi:hypothetical protein WA026_011316 [Henosepilachna vigintioctopunctata]|uniref:Uncharacterized protein n=1 Tax=Henosepilachna vigintioctopunctata TaxID=420089 RepID=A0AAW1U5I5_9CUCU